MNRAKAAAEREGQCRPVVDGDFNLLQLLLYTLEKGRSLIGRRVRHDDGELVAADSVHNIFLPEIYTKELREELQNLGTAPVICVTWKRTSGPELGITKPKHLKAGTL